MITWLPRDSYVVVHMYITSPSALDVTIYRNDIPTGLHLMTPSALAVTIYSDYIPFGFALDNRKFPSCYYKYIHLMITWLVRDSNVLINMSITYDVNSVICNALRFVLYKNVHNSNWHPPYLIHRQRNSSIQFYNIKKRYVISSLFKLIHVFLTQPLIHHIHYLTLRDRCTLVSLGGLPIRDPAPYQTWT